MFMQNPNPGHSSGSTQLQQKARGLIGRPVGISFRNGTGTSGILCSVQSDQLFVLQYLYATQFATFHYPFVEVADILPFPSCR